MGVQRISRWAVTIAVAIVSLIVLSGTWRYVIENRALAHRSRIVGRLSQAAFILKCYEFNNGILPPAFTNTTSGARLHSWRVLCLLDPPNNSTSNGIQLKEPWDSPANQAAAVTNHDGSSSYFTLTRDESTACVLAVTGPNSLWDPETGSPNGSIASMPNL